MGSGESTRRGHETLERDEKCRVDSEGQKTSGGDAKGRGNSEASETLGVGGRDTQKLEGLFRNG